jgi:hypothetical protein
MPMKVTPRPPEIGPAVSGRKVTLIVQLEPGPTDLPQLFVSLKDELFTTMVLMVSAVLPRLSKVTVCGGLDWPTGTVPKFKIAGVSVTPKPSPLSVTN